MKTAVPLSRIAEVAPLAKAGAGEFYCGLLDDRWTGKFGLVESVSRRNSRSAHFTSASSLKEAVRRAHLYGIPVHGVINESYHKGQLEMLKRQVEDYESAGIDGIIVGDMAILLTLREWGFKGFIIMGTGGVAMNSATVKLYQSLGTGRIILPRHLSIADIRSVTEEVPCMEYEVFIFRGLCPFIDGYCRFQHGLRSLTGGGPQDDLACNMKFRVSTCTGRGCPASSDNQLVKKALSKRQSLTGCGLCALYDFADIKGITALKIVGREFSSKEKLENQKTVKEFIDILQNSPSIEKAAYYKLCREKFKYFFGKKCTEKDCYHPEEDFGFVF